MMDDLPATYEEVWFAYIDILGFKGYVRDAVQQEREEIVILDLKETLGNAMREVREFSSIDRFPASVRLLSDTLCIAMPTHADLSRLGFLQMVASAVSGMALSMGLFCRGAIARGQHYDDGALIFSPALIEAYLTEKSLAVYPRVIVPGPLVVGEDELTNDAEFEEFRQNIILQDTDGQWFLNYLNGVQFEDPEEGCQKLFSHKQHIEEGLRTKRNDPRVFAKYCWLATYHDRFCSEMLTEPDRHGLLVNNNEAEVRSTRPKCRLRWEVEK